MAADLVKLNQDSDAVVGLVADRIEAAAHTNFYDFRKHHPDIFLPSHLEAAIEIQTALTFRNYLPIQPIDIWVKQLVLALEITTGDIENFSNRDAYIWKERLNRLADILAIDGAMKEQKRMLNAKLIAGLLGLLTLLELSFIAEVIDTLDERETWQTVKMIFDCLLTAQSALIRSQHYEAFDMAQAAHVYGRTAGPSSASKKRMAYYVPIEEAARKHVVIYFNKMEEGYQGWSKTSWAKAFTKMMEESWGGQDGLKRKFGVRFPTHEKLIDYVDTLIPDSAKAGGRRKKKPPKC